MTSLPPAASLACSSADSIPSVTKWNVVPPSLHLHGITRVMGENEHGVMVGRVVAPPARPLLVAPGTTVDRAEHVSAHHASPDVLARFLEYPCALVHLAARLAVGLAPGCQRNHPTVEPLAALAERVLLALVRAGDETVQRDRDMTPKFAHRASSVGGRCARTHPRSTFSDCGTYFKCFRSRWRLHTAGARWAGRPGSLPPSGWTASRPGRALRPGQCRGRAACPGR